MPSLEDIELYIRFDGDPDGLSRSELGGQVSDEDWRLIDELCQDMHLVLAGVASEAFAARFARKLSASTVDEPTRKKIEAYVRGRL